MLRKLLYSFRCTYCDKVFTTMDYLENHIIHRHLSELKEEAESERKVIEERHLEQQIRDEHQKVEQQEQLLK